MKNKQSIYSTALFRTMDEMEKDCRNKDLIKKYVLYAVKLFNEFDDPVTHDDVELSFQLSSMIHFYMGKLTPSEFMNVFPIKKEFDGHKYDLIDYFYTKEYVDSMNQHKSLGDKHRELLWEYLNDDLMKFKRKTLGLLSVSSQLEGNSDPVIDYFAQQEVTTQRKFTDQNGTEYLLNNNGKTQKVIKEKPSYLKLVK